MGAPTALNIVKAQYSMVVNDLDKDKSTHLLKAGAVWADSAFDAVKGVDIVMTSLPGPKQVEALAIGTNNILDNMKKGAIWIDLSTNNLDVMKKMQKQANERNIRIMDAPVSGGTEGAADGSLSIYVGGSAADYDEVKDLLNIIGNDVRHLGENGAGYVAKIAQVILCYLHSVALSEALMLGVKGGVNAGDMLDIIKNSTGRSYVSNRYGTAILDGTYDPGFTLGLAHKDMGLALNLAKSMGANLPLCEQVEDIYARAVQKYGFDRNHLMAVKLLEDDNGKDLRG